MDPVTTTHRVSFVKATPLARSPLTFGTTPQASGTPSNASEKKPWYQPVVDLANRLIGLVKAAMGLFEGILGSYTVLSNADSWQQALTTANPQSGYWGRTRTWLSIAYATGRNNLDYALQQARSSQGKAQHANDSFQRYEHILNEYPRLLTLHNQLPGGLNLVEQAILSQRQPGYSDEIRNTALTQLKTGNFSGLDEAACRATLQKLLYPPTAPAA
jgi:hypothetical protein